MPRIADVNHRDAVSALQRAGFRIVRESKHIVMTDGSRIITVPRNDPIDACTMAGIAGDAGLTIEVFRTLL